MTITADHPRRFSIERDMSNGLYDVWDAHLCAYIVCDVRRAAAERALQKARSTTVAGDWWTWRTAA